MAQNYDVSAIITCMTDRERPFIRQSVISALGQSYPCEIIIIVEQNNEWVERELSGLERLQIIRLPLRAAGWVRNKGTLAAKSEFVAFLDSDDWWHPHKIEKQFGVARRSGADLVGCLEILCLEDGRPFAFGHGRYFAKPSGWLVKRQILLDHPFDEHLRAIEDGDWWIRTGSRVSKVRLSQYLFRYRVSTTSYSATAPTTLRKIRFAQIATNSAVARFAILAGSFIYSIIGYGAQFKPSPDWK